MGDLKNRVRYTTTLDPSTLSSIRLLSKVTKIPQSQLVEEAIDLLFSVSYYKDRLRDEFKADFAENAEQQD